MFESGLIVGILLGYVLQRGHFCISGHLNRIMHDRSVASVLPIALAIAIQSVGFYILNSLGFITIPTSPMPIMATLLGSLLFGVGMGIAGCCVTGQLFRAGEGLVSAWITLAVFSITTIVTQTGLLKYYIGDVLKTSSTMVTIPQTLGFDPLWCVVTFCILTAVGVILYGRKEYREAGHWRGTITGAVIGVIGVVAWYLSAMAGRDFGLSFTIPLGNFLQFLLLDQQRYLNWGTYLVIGVVVGAFIGAFTKKQWRKDSVTPISFVKSISGGLLMGVGAALTGGCTMANVIVSTAYFSWQGWVAAVVMSFGLWITLQVARRI